MRRLAVLLLLAGVALGQEQRRATSESIAVLEAKKAALFARKRFDETGHVRLGRPGGGSWLAVFAESGQDDEEYRATCDNRRSKERDRIYVTEMGELSSRCLAALPAVREYVQAYFQLTVAASEPVGLPRRFFVEERKQYDGDKLLRLVKADVPDDALAHVALLEQDLFAQGLNFVFGQASGRAGLYSVARLGGEGETLYRTRIFRLVTHELGHVLGMDHCVYYECVMNGGNSLAEGDRMPLHPCPVCLEKLRWNAGFDPVAREKQLLAILEREGLSGEAAWSRARIARLEKR